MDDWTRVGDPKWRAVDGVIQSRASDDTNSGVYMRCAGPNSNTDRTCYKANIFDRRPDPTYGTGAIVHLAAVSPMPKAGGRWNTFDITVRGSRLTVDLNGTRTAEVEDARLASGPIALQYAAGVVKFRKVQIQPL
jgi:hypothetical protein